MFKRAHIAHAHQPLTLIDLLSWRAAHQPDHLAYSFLVDGEDEKVHSTYARLDQSARAIAGMLQSFDLRGERALLLYPPGLDFIAGFFGCLYAGVIAVPAYPPDPARLSRTLPRLQAIAWDAQAKAVLTTQSMMPLAQRLSTHAPDLKSLRWLASDNIEGDFGSDWENRGVGGDTVAFLQYTSGSTGDPKGVMLSHQNLLHNASLVYDAVEHSPEDSYLSWLPAFHDMGFMAGVLQPLYAGIPAVLMSPLAFLERPFRWLHGISRHKATTSGGPNFAYDLCVRKITAEERAALDLSSWSVAFNGAEPIRRETVERFVAAFEPCGFRRETFYPCYGLAEATLIVSGGDKFAAPISTAIDRRALETNRVTEASVGDDAEVIVGCGRCLPDQQVIIVDPESLTACPPDQIGEIWVSGPSVAQGYWNRQDETGQTFRACLADGGEGPFLRTGDLGFVREGELYVTGRLKDLIIIRGLNHYPQDIEFTVEKSDPALRPGCGAAFSVEANGEERLVVVQEVGKRHESGLEKIVDSIRRAVAENHELAAHAVILLRAGSVPKTSSGKIQRSACRRAFIEGTFDELIRDVREESLDDSTEPEVSLRTLLDARAELRPPLLELYLRQQMSRMLRVPIFTLNSEKPLISLGMDSLMAAELRSRVETDLGVLVPVGTFLAGLNISQLASQFSDRLGEKTHTPLAYSSSTEEQIIEHTLSYTQQALWFIHQLAPDSAAYNIAFAARVCSEVDTEAMRHAFQALVDRHAPLRTTYTTRDGLPIQRVHRQVSVSFEVVDCSARDEADFKARVNDAARRPFDLERGPVFRATLFTRSAEEHVLLIAVHHISFDGWSLWVLLDELLQLYSAERSGAQSHLPPLAARYSDYVRWQAEMLNGPEGERSWGYWQNKLSGDLPMLSLPLDRPRPPAQTYRGASHHFMIGESLTESLKSLAESEGATLYMILLATFQVMLHRHTGQDDILVGSPTSARSRAEFDGVAGCFFNAIVLRADFSADPAFRDFLRQVRATVLEAIDHQDYPSHLLAERLQPVRDPGRPPLFQATFILQKPHRAQEASLILAPGGDSAVNLGGLMMNHFPLENRHARSELEMEVIEARGALHCRLQYNSDLFAADSIGRMAEHTLRLAEGVVACPQARVSALPLLGDAESDRLLVEWSNSGRTYPGNLLVTELFHEQVMKTPDRLAAVDGDSSYTFQELNDKADRLARLLRRLIR